MDSATAQHLPVPIANDHPLLPAVEMLSAKARGAMYEAATRGPLRRRTWDGCALNRAGLVLGETVDSRRRAVKALGASPRAVRRFLSVWDRLIGPDRACTALLREAIITVELEAEWVRPEPVRTEPVRTLVSTGD